MPSPIDPAAGAPCVLKGNVATMDDAFSVIDRGVVYIRDGAIVAVGPQDAPAPPEFGDAPVVDTRGTIFPGLIELHNHLSYNVLPLWSAPAKFQHRGQWAGTPLYRKFISGPMQILGRTRGYPEAIVRYVEVKCLLAGVTSTQGMSLFSAPGITRFYRGHVRNVENTGDPDLPDAATKIPDVAATDVEQFFLRLKASSCLLLHLSEGKGDAARRHFLALRRAGGTWAVTGALTGIHAAGLEREDFAVLAGHGASIVWSPLSNYLLYGDTADIAAAKAEGVNATLGSDWSPSGSKNLLAELKVAKAASDHLGGLYSDREIVAMATRNAAKALKWDRSLGSIEPGKRADLIVLTGTAGDPFSRLIEANETAIALVMIDGAARAGKRSLMTRFGAVTEEVKIGTTRRALNLDQAAADPIVGALTLGQARERLTDGLNRLPQLATALETAPVEKMSAEALDEGTGWYLVLDHEDVGAEFSRMAMETQDLEPMTAAELEMAAAPLSEIVEPMTLDAIAVAGEAGYGAKIKASRNLPEFLRTAF